jgi:hypothetical protein
MFHHGEGFYPSPGAGEGWDGELCTGRLHNGFRPKKSRNFTWEMASLRYVFPVKVLCHNLCVLIQAIHELGIKPAFHHEHATFLRKALL